jgi:hypothetical protein
MASFNINRYNSYKKEKSKYELLTSKSKKITSHFKKSETTVDWFKSDYVKLEKNCWPIELVLSHHFLLVSVPSR